MVLAPHPDDESIGCAGVIQEAARMGLPVRVLFLTYGDGNQWSFMVYRKHPVVMPGAVLKMGMTRHNEALAAGKALGLSPIRLFFLGYPDVGTLFIWYDHWGKADPYRSILTHATEVPYADAWRPGAPYTGENLLRDLTDVLRDFKPTKVFVSHPGDFHPDHRALYLFTRVALWDLGRDSQVELLPYLVHYSRWPEPQGAHPELPLDPPDPFDRQIQWKTWPLTDSQKAVKRTALESHKTQFDYSADYLLSFLRGNELFGDFPPVRLRDQGGGGWAENTDVSGHPSRWLTDEEKAAYVGIETRYMYLEGSNLVTEIGFSRPVAGTVEASIFLMGYRADRPFSEMPKVRVNLGAGTHRMMDMVQGVPLGTAGIVRRSRSIKVSVPLSVLGDPDRILTTAHTYLEKIPLDWVSWRVLDVGGSD